MVTCVPQLTTRWTRQRLYPQECHIFHKELRNDSSKFLHLIVNRVPVREDGDVILNEQGFSERSRISFRLKYCVLLNSLYNFWGGCVNTVGLLLCVWRHFSGPYSIGRLAINVSSGQWLDCWGFQREVIQINRCQRQRVNILRSWSWFGNHQ